MSEKSKISDILGSVSQICPKIGDAGADLLPVRIAIG